MILEGSIKHTLISRIECYAFPAGSRVIGGSTDNSDTDYLIAEEISLDLLGDLGMALISFLALKEVTLVGSMSTDNSDGMYYTLRLESDGIDITVGKDNLFMESFKYATYQTQGLLSGMTHTKAARTFIFEAAQLSYLKAKNCGNVHLYGRFADGVVREG